MSLGPLWALAVVSLAAAQQTYNAQNIPNPGVQYQQCNMLTFASICDPDAVMNKGDRYRVDHKLGQVEASTRQENTQTFCERKGITSRLVVVRRIENHNTAGAARVGDELLNNWHLDDQCEKAIVIIVAVEDGVYYVARDRRVPLSGSEFTQIFGAQRAAFQQKNWGLLFDNVLNDITKQILAKKGAPVLPPGGGSGPGPAGPGGFGGGGGGGKGFQIPDFVKSKTFWLILICVVIPLLCCCGCMYCCCCRGKGGDAGGEAGGGGGGGGGGGFMGLNCGQIMNTAAGMGIGNIIGRLFSSSGGGNRNQGYADGGQRGFMPSNRPQPTYDDNAGEGGKGSYPSKATEDRGGGGSWA